MDKFQNKYRIPSTRIQKWDYRWDAAYFITVCAKNHEHFFGKIEKGKMVFTHSGILADVFWVEIKNHFQHVELGEFVVMPNHMHGILILNGNEIPTKNVNVFEKFNNENGANVVETRHALSLQSPNVLPLQSNPIQQSNPILPSNPDTQPNPDKIFTNHQKTPIQAKTIGQTRFQNQGKNSVSSIVGSYKSAVTKHINRLGLCNSFSWQARFYDHIIRDDGEFQKITWYIRHNPSNWTEDKFYN